MARDDGGFWVGCDGCDEWFDLPCTDIETEELPEADMYYCQKCRVLFQIKLLCRVGLGQRQ